MNTGNNPIYSDNGLLTTLAAGSTKDKPEYALEEAYLLPEQLYSGFVMN